MSDVVDWAREQKEIENTLISNTYISIKPLEMVRIPVSKLNSELFLKLFKSSADYIHMDKTKLEQVLTLEELQQVIKLIKE